MANQKPHTTARDVSLVIIAVVASAAALYFGREVFVPIAFAFLFNVIFRPAVRGLQRLRIPAPIGAGIVTLAVIAAIVGIGWALVTPAQKWFSEAPQHLKAAEAKIKKLRQPIDKAKDVAQKITDATSGPTTQPSEPPAAPAPSVLTKILGNTTSLFAGLSEVILLGFLLLAADDMLLQKVVKIVPTRRDKQIVVKAANDVQAAVFRYVWVTLLLNLGQAACVTVALKFIGVPNPMLWGVLTFVLEFVPYLGGLILFALLTVTCVATFDTVGRIIAGPLAYLTISTIQNNVASPIAYGNRLKLNPIAVFIGVVVWWFLWGIPGAFIAVPIVALIKIVADRTEGMKPLGELLGA